MILRNLRVTPERDRRPPFAFRVRGVVDPRGHAPRLAAGARLRVTVSRRGERETRRTTRVGPRGRFALRVRVAPEGRRGRLVLAVRFEGTRELKPKTVKCRVRYGR